LPRNHKIGQFVGVPCINTKHHIIMSATTTRKPLRDLNNVAPPSKKQRPINEASVEKPNQSGAKGPSSPDGSSVQNDEILIRNWLTLPHSQFGVHYNLGATKTYKHPPTSDQRGIAILQMAANKCAFALKMQELKDVLHTKYPTGAGLVYVREIFEAGDPEYGPTWQLRTSIDVTTITQEQMSRFRIMIVDDKRGEVMLSYLRFYEMLPFDAACSVVDHFEAFKKRYAKLRDHRVKFNQIFCFTFALCKFDGWMYRMERALGRSKMVEGLATRWKNLLLNRTPEELGLDIEFSYAAVQALLQSFKEKVANAPTFGDPRMVFKYE
jgi:hypothetical protein